MPARVGLVACLAAFVVACSGSEDSAPEWNHDLADSTLGPPAWGEIDESFGTCADGREQSPVDISGAIPVQLPVLMLDYVATPIVVENTGHTIEAVMPEGGTQTLTIDGTEYRLLQYHFHAPSEHTLDGRSFAAEVHLVHESADGELAVVGVFLDESEISPTEPTDTVIDSAPATAGEEVEVDDAPSPMLFYLVAESFGASVARYFTYRGSLTTPGCSEGVRWIVSPEPGRISSDALSRLHELIADFPEYDGYENNNRPTQSLNGRTIERGNGG